MTKVGNQVGASEPEAAPKSTQMPYPAIATGSQEIPATLVTAKTLLLLTSRPKFDRTVTPIDFEPAQSSASQSGHTAKLPFKAPSNVDAFLDATEVQMHLLLANQHTLMENQCNMDRRMEYLERRIGRME